MSLTLDRDIMEVWMGCWGDKPWDNDVAADWFNGFSERTKIADEVAEGLSKDPKDSPEVVRAAAHLVYLLGHVYAWPIERLRVDLELAATKLEELLEREWEPAEPLKSELQDIRARLEPKRVMPSKTVAPPEDTTKPTPNGGQLRSEWSLDLAGKRQRLSSSAFKAGEPSVRVLKPIGRGRLLASTLYHLQTIDIATGKRVRNLTHGSLSGVESPEKVSDNGRYVVPLEGIAVRDAHSDKTLFETESNRTAKLVLSQDGTKLLQLNWEGKLCVHDVDSQETLFELQHDNPKGPDACCRISLDGRRAATGFGGSVCFWDLETGKRLRRLRNKTGSVLFTPDGKRAITRTPKTCDIWELETVTKEHQIPLHPLTDQLISPDNRAVFEIAPWKLSEQLGEVVAMREWDRDAHRPFALENVRIDYDWIGNDRVVTWRDIVEVGKIATFEARLWNLNPIELAGAAQVEPLPLPSWRSKTPMIAAVKPRRIAASAEDKMVFVGSGNAQVFGFRIVV